MPLTISNLELSTYNFKKDISSSLLGLVQKNQIEITSLLMDVELVLSQFMYVPKHMIGKRTSKVLYVCTQKLPLDPYSISSPWEILERRVICRLMFVEN